MPLAPNKQHEFEALFEKSQQCCACALCDKRTSVVFGSGNLQARVVFVGEAPGKNEDLGGKPFIGAAGKLLDELLASADIVRDELYITNVVKCRPPANRNPHAAEINACHSFLHSQLALIDPDVVVTLGAFAMRAMLGGNQSITQLRGKSQHLGKFVVLPVFHPAAALYDPTKREVLLHDFSVLGDILKDEHHV